MRCLLLCVLLTARSAATGTMDPQAGLPQLYYPQDPLRAGLTHLKDAATPHHPLETALKQVCAARIARPHV